MKILVIDPWGVKTLSSYSSGFYFGLSKCSELTVISNYYFENKNKINCHFLKYFFKKSENMKDGIIRKLVRGFEYVNAYRKIISHIKKNKYDVVEIEWLLMYKIDVYFIKKIKKYTKVLYKAHNVIPHEHGENQVGSLNKIYSAVDWIILHGNSIKKEFDYFFPNIDDAKIIIQPFGTFDMDVSFDIEAIPNEIVDEVKSFKRKYIFFGGLFFNKGVDRLISVWAENSSKEALLIVAGKSSSDYVELKEQASLIESLPNILFLDEFVCDNTLNYLIHSSDVVLIPYRHASMSGVLFTAAAFSKPVMCTDVGSLGEYFVNSSHGFLVSNDDNGINKGLKLLNQTTKEELKEKGVAFNNYVKQNYAWETICRLLVKEIDARLAEGEL